MRDLIERMRSLEQDHTPDGWPAVQMREISALCDLAERAEAQVAATSQCIGPGNGCTCNRCAEQCTYPDCNCPFDMGPDHQCLRGLPVIRK